MKKKIIAIGILSNFIFNIALAEIWPTLETYVKDCILIVMCKTVVEEKKVKFKLDEVWKGKYSVDLCTLTSLRRW